MNPAIGACGSVHRVIDQHVLLLGSTGMSCD